MRYSDPPPTSGPSGRIPAGMPRQARREGGRWRDFVGTMDRDEMAFYEK